MYLELEKIVSNNGTIPEDSVLENSPSGSMNDKV